MLLFISVLLLLFCTHFLYTNFTFITFKESRLSIKLIAACLLSCILAYVFECGTPCTPPLIVVVGHYAQSAAVGEAGS